MKKIFGLMGALILMLSPLASAGAYSSAGASSYLLAHANNPWSTMALSVLGASNIPNDYLKAVSGSKAIDFEAPILAIASLNQDPRNFGSQDLVAQLESFHSGGQIGDPTALNDDIFGILALLSAGQSPADSAIADSKSFLLAHQNQDGGWGFSTTSSSDSNTTASAIVALAADGISADDAHIQNALTYLKTAQNNDGGFTYDPNSQFGTDSDSSSTAWVMWALNALNIDQATWSRSGHSPADYLQGNQDASGFFKFQSSFGEDSFSAVTTAYAVIALAGKTLPVHIISAGNSAETFHFRIEGSQNTVCDGQALGPTALDVIKNAGTACGFTYDIKSTSFGPYLDQINDDTASGQTGWLYLVNDISPDVGAADFQLKSGDDVLWYFGDFGWLPTRLSLDQTKIATGQSAQATVEAFSNGSWSPLSGATISAGTQTFTSDDSGHASVTNQDGFYKVQGQKTSYIRSNQVLLQIGQPSSSSVSLTANISAGGQVQGTSTQTSTLSFSVNPADLDFGNLSAGASASKKITISNTGSGNLHIESIVSGDSLFTDNLSINSLPWQSFRVDLTASQSQDENVKLTVPASLSNGQKNGQLIFWASAE